MKTLVEYVAPNGKNYFKKWLLQLTTIQQDLIDHRLKRVKDGNYGNTTNEGSGVIAVRFIKEGLRIYISNIDSITIILLCGGDKSSKAQQNKDIQQAKEFLEEFKNRI